MKGNNTFAITKNSTVIRGNISPKDIMIFLTKWSRLKNTDCGNRSEIFTYIKRIQTRMIIKNPGLFFLRQYIKCVSKTDIINSKSPRETASLRSGSLQPALVFKKPSIYGISPSLCVFSQMSFLFLHKDLRYFAPS